MQRSFHDAYSDALTSPKETWEPAVPSPKARPMRVTTPLACAVDGDTASRRGEARKSRMVPRAPTAQAVSASGADIPLMPLEVPVSFISQVRPPSRVLATKPPLPDTQAVSLSGPGADTPLRSAAPRAAVSSGNQVRPPSPVRRTVPSSPTAQAVSLSVPATAARSWEVPDSWCSQVSPASSVLMMTPPRPTAQAVSASAAYTPMSSSPCSRSWRYQV